MVYAVEGGCLVVVACGLLSREKQDIRCNGDPALEVLCPVSGGYTKIYTPDGQSIGTEIAHTDKGLVTANVDLSIIACAKITADPAGHYARPDVTRLMLNAKPQRPVMAFEETSSLVIDLALDVSDLGIAEDTP